MIDSTPQFRLREYPRYPTRDDRAVEVFIRKQSSPSADAVVGELLDFSRRGVRLIVAAPFEAEEIVKLRIKWAAPATDLSISARVCWTAQQADDSWLLGCQFVSELPFNIVPRLAAAGYLERRTEVRYDVNFPAAVRCQGAAWDADVEVQNISDGGFRIRAPQAIQPGEEFILLLNCDGSRLEILARAQWRAEADGAYLIGCSFPSPEGLALLSQAAAEAELTGV